jgi:hypothetical protein
MFFNCVLVVKYRYRILKLKSLKQHGFIINNILWIRNIKWFSTVIFLFFIEKKSRNWKHTPVWDPLEPGRICWNPLGPVETHWNPLESVGTRWNLLEPVGTRWDRLEPVGTRWNPLEPVGTCWNLFAGGEFSNSIT